MKHIQWFPGHMTKAMRMMEDSVKLCDGVLVILDARAPAATYNKNLKKLFGNKPVLYVLNKSDLADEGRAKMAFARSSSAAARTPFRCVRPILPPQSAWGRRSPPCFPKNTERTRKRVCAAPTG